MTCFRFAWISVFLSFALTGCVSDMLARKIVRAPNLQTTPGVVKNPKLAAFFDVVYAQSWRVETGSPRTELAVAVIEPGQYQLNHQLVFQDNADGSRSMSVNTQWRPRSEGISPVPKATLVLLHGIMMTKESMAHWGVYLAEQGYRAVLVDLRGHGRSGGEWVTFGATEAADLRRVLDELERRHLASGPVGVLGVSYGAVMALHWAAQDPRVTTVVAIEPFSDAQQAIVEFARGFLKKQTGKLSDATFAQATQRASALAGFNWSDVNVMDSLQRIQVPILFYHGARDTWLSPRHSEKLAAHAPQGSRLVVMSSDDHITLSARLDPIAPNVVTWFEERLKSAKSPMFASVPPPQSEVASRSGPRGRWHYFSLTWK